MPTEHSTSTTTPINNNQRNFLLLNCFVLSCLLFSSSLPLVLFARRIFHQFRYNYVTRDRVRGCISLPRSLRRICFALICCVAHGRSSMKSNFICLQEQKYWIGWALCFGSRFVVERASEALSALCIDLSITSPTKDNALLSGFARCARKGGNWLFGLSFRHEYIFLAVARSPWEFDGSISVRFIHFLWSAVRRDKARSRQAIFDRFIGRCTDQVCKARTEDYKRFVLSAVLGCLSAPKRTRYRQRDSNQYINFIAPP